MSLIDDVKTICDRLAPLGWRDRILTVTNNVLDISQPSSADLEAALTQTLTAIDRTQPGFTDFDPEGAQGITGGQPAQSLLYHALASPDVHPTPSGDPAAAIAYATLADLDTIENYIYSLVRDRTDLADTVIAVFAYQYRVASRSSHRRHADLTYSRTGVARVGTTTAHYDAARRSFWVIPAAGGDALPVLPARYGVFLARRATPGAAGSVQGAQSNDTSATFLFPVHKLFSGDECLQGQTLGIDVLEFHRNEKLRKTHQLPAADGGLPVPAGFDTAQLPYVRDSSNGGNLVTREMIGASALIVPQPGVTLVHTVTQQNTVANTEQLVHFQVPSLQTVRGRTTRFAESTLEIPAFGADRLAPEYVNIRHAIDPAGPVTQPLQDLNTLNAAEFATAMTDGGYAAAHFLDDSCDGCVEAVVTGLTRTVENLPAFSLITAPDFFPLADQYEMETSRTIIRVEPLSKGRLPVNPSLPRPSDRNTLAFPPQDTTVTAIVGAPATGTAVPIAGVPNRMISFLPDAASNVFAPGWDVSRSRNPNTTEVFLTSSGLGSPFPEDAKLCAALASFWPAVAPDNGRTFGNEGGFGNQLPMLDAELGFHPNHEQVTAGAVTSYTGWDGEFGPFFETVSGTLMVNYVAIERSDYVSEALANRIRVSLTADVQSEDLIARHQALNAAQGLLGPTNAQRCLVVFRRVDNWAAASPGDARLQGSGFLLEFADLTGNRQPVSATDLKRVRKPVQTRHICQVGTNGIAYKAGDADFIFVPGQAFG